MSDIEATPDHPDLAEVAARWRSAYVHVPFCVRVCPYCDFAVVAGSDDRMSAYFDAVLAEIDQEPEWEPLDAVFIGGGTPSRASAEDLSRVLSRLRSRFGLVPGAEVTLEANPEDWTPQLAAALVDGGFTRVSFGAQSFDRAVLDALGRMHTPEQTVEAISVARQAGFESVSIDLIFGSPAEGDASWRATVEAAIECEPDHVSAYSLTVEPGTVLWREVRRGAQAPDPDDQADRWEVASELLADAGYVRYEVSNHARPGHACRYNLSVWGQGEYLAFGLGAHGFRGGTRSRRVRRLDTYIERVGSGIGPIQATDLVEGWDAELERLMLGLRRTAGVRLGPGGTALVESPMGRRLIDADIIEVQSDRLVVTRPLLTDEAIRAVLDLEAN